MTKLKLIRGSIGKTEHHTKHRAEIHPTVKEKKAEICKEAKYWEHPGYHKYIAVHGEHFSRKLSEWACKQMLNRNGMLHTWTPEQVETAIEKMGYTLDCTNKYDAHYLANMAYADYFGSSIDNEPGCLLNAIDVINGNDGYKEKAFIHWLAYTMKKCFSIDWEMFI